MKSIIHAARVGTSEVHTKYIRKSSYFPLEKEVWLDWILTGSGNCLTRILLHAAMKYRVSYQERMFQLHFRLLRWKVTVRFHRAQMDALYSTYNCCVIWHEDCLTFKSKRNSEHSSGVTWHVKSTFSWRMLFARIIETRCNLKYLSLKQHTLTDNVSKTSLSYRLRNKHDNKREVAKLGVAVLLQGEQLRCVSRYFTWINPSSSFLLYSFLSTILQFSRHTLEFLNRWSVDCCWFAPSFPSVRTFDVALPRRWQSSQLAGKFYVFYWPNVYYRLLLVSTDYTKWISRPLSYPICLRSTSTFQRLKCELVQTKK